MLRISVLVKTAWRSNSKLVKTTLVKSVAENHAFFIFNPISFNNVYKYSRQENSRRSKRPAN